MPGAVAVVLGGSRAVGAAREDSDWDLGVYYRSTGRRFDPQEVRGLGYSGSVTVGTKREATGLWSPAGGGACSCSGTTASSLVSTVKAVEDVLAVQSAGKE